ncbi:30S ribosomal protein S18 [Streptomyces sp. NPDC059835]|uniref:30S ribosomal protein S18 n=1 Tax=Streptomyces sp. NPDC059835 TaxID=3346967 RepID=UPI00364FD3DB
MRRGPLAASAPGRGRTCADARGLRLPPRSRRKFVSDRGKIRGRRVTRVTVRQQRDLATAIKNAREMALLPYASR